MENKNCTFCQIISSELPSYKIAETQNVLAFLDAKPLTRGEILIVPKAHLNMWDSTWSSDTDRDVLTLARKIGTALQKTYGYKNVILHAANGSNQEVPHFHMHVYGSKPKDDPLYFETIKAEDFDTSQKQTQGEIVGVLDIKSSQ